MLTLIRCGPVLPRVSGEPLTFLSLACPPKQGQARPFLWAAVIIEAD